MFFKDLSSKPSPGIGRGNVSAGYPPASLAVGGAVQASGTPISYSPESRAARSLVRAHAFPPAGAAFAGCAERGDPVLSWVYRLILFIEVLDGLVDAKEGRGGGGNTRDSECDYTHGRGPLQRVRYRSRGI